MGRTLILASMLIVGLGCPGFAQNTDANGTSAATNPANDSVTDAEFHKHVTQLKEKLGADDFHVLIERPFVVVGDEPVEQVKKRTEQTIRWAVTNLKKTYFKHDPDHIIEIWLFKDKDSYEANCEKYFGTKPTTPFGFYSSTHRALIMNISTGGGTLVHEIVHPYIAANFPECPSWFNEGLASLYEQCGEENGKIVGYTNWRLKGLQNAIADNRVPSFSDLMKTSRRGFYDDDPGTNYSHARYLCYYLQERGKLGEFYREFKKNHGRDPTGEKTLCQLLGTDDLGAFKKEWEKFISELKF